MNRIIYYSYIQLCDMCTDQLEIKKTLGFQFSSHTFFNFNLSPFSSVKLLWLCPSGRMTTSVWVHLCFDVWSSLLPTKASRDFPLGEAVTNCTAVEEAPANSYYSLAFTSGFWVGPTRMLQLCCILSSSSFCCGYSGYLGVWSLRGINWINCPF